MYYPLKERAGLGTMATDGKNIYYDPKFVEKLDKDETMEVGGNQHETIKGSIQKKVDKNNNETVKGSSKILTKTLELSVENLRNDWCGGGINIDGSTINLNSGLAFKTNPKLPKE